MKDSLFQQMVLEYLDTRPKKKSHHLKIKLIK